MRAPATVPTSRLLLSEHGQRVARSGDAAQLRPRPLPAGGRQPQLRRLLRGHRDGERRGRGRVARRALRDRARAAGRRGRSVPFAAQGFIPASNGFPGFPDYTAGVWTRNNVAAYGDLELRGLDDRWSAGAAVRVEHFDVFGNTTNGKLSFRYGLSDAVSVRGGVSTGFRAPTPGQQNALNVQTTIDPETAGAGRQRHGAVHLPVGGVCGAASRSSPRRRSTRRPASSSTRVRSR